MPIKIYHKESGLGLIFAVIQWFAFTKLWLKLTEIVWPSLIKFQYDYEISDANFILIFATTAGFLTLFIGNLFFVVIYKLKLPFFEKYKALDEPWPWESDPVAWNDLKWRSIKLSLFNLFVTGPISNILPAFLE